MIQTIRNIIADYLIEWAMKLYGNEPIGYSLAQWIIKNFPTRYENKPNNKEKKEKIYKDSQLVYAAVARCLCGAGMAYAPGEMDYWDCSAILKGVADVKVKHEAKLPFVFYKIKSENQPSANGRTTRPDIDIARGLLASAYQIALRDGVKTNWEAFRKQVKKFLDKLNSKQEQTRIYDQKEKKI